MIADCYIIYKRHHQLRVLSSLAGTPKDFDKMMTFLELMEQIWKKEGISID